MKKSVVLIWICMMLGAPAFSQVDSKTADRVRAAVTPLMSQMAAAANRHDVEGHVGFYAHDPGVTLIFNGTPIVGWENIRDKQREWWNQGNTDVVYTIQGTPDVQVASPTVVITTQLLKARRTKPNGEIAEGEFAVTSVWQKRPEGWRVIYGHESTVH